MACMRPLSRCFSVSARTSVLGAEQRIHLPIVNPADSAPTDRLAKYGMYLMTAFPKYIQLFSLYKDELSLHISPSGLVPIMTFLKYHTNAQFKSVMDIACVDYPTKSNRFEVVYNILSHRWNARLRVKTYANEASSVPSITDLFQGANWYEREAYDMFGVFFSNHPDLRRILTDYGFEGHPLRKDFPLTGYTEVRYDEEKKRVVVEPLQLQQAFRNFEAQSVWEPVGKGVDKVPENMKTAEPKLNEGKKEK
ncbi:NADH-ubiquinone oxidoreductase 30 subunit, mitochondrial [Neolecta irregularis DAH-3]|uniref:NADH-ubiquinone oxidoreductase 30 subunit, mitochondrial n=1 Tax=Neolecta irregularis (strain DAH-3) TaxID=1198029 RepID=A0A1U7LK70_NEOID|nr:NADH-ubiquinone oxidoreductase 30 subunit, mitochondrial [Neolecta irregularis DAH-3]|eukprot:OLL23028.1 NADH-ubiquinone oxidoreductase 30 subunit, mitochondrial [Neolecta irregularis DAH-3]